ncbi:MAG: hypothetical protein ABIG46_08195 [Candidatus Omnitrophota bacterium]|nr:hypothetical protein [Candidatus Omnitrophota bacterium]
MDSLADSKDKSISRGQIFAATVSNIPIFPGMFCIYCKHQSYGKDNQEYSNVFFSFLNKKEVLATLKANFTINRG